MLREKRGNRCWVLIWTHLLKECKLVSCDKLASCGKLESCGKISPGLQIRVHNQKLIILSLIENTCFGCLKEPSHIDGSYEHPKQMLKLMNFSKLARCGVVWRL